MIFLTQGNYKDYYYAPPKDSDACFLLGTVHYI